MNQYRASTKLYLWGLAFWAVIGFSQPKLIPGMATFAVGAVLAALVFLSEFRRLAFMFGPTALVLLALASPAWSGDSAGWQRGALYACVTVAGVVIASYLPPSDAIRIFDSALKLVAVTTAVMYVFVPAVAIDSRWPNVGSLIGPYVHKNPLGTMLVLGLVTTLYVRRVRWKKWGTVLWVVFYIGLIVLTRSSTALALAIITLAVAWMMGGIARRQARGKAAYITLTAVLLVILAPVLIAASNEILGILGRDTTLSGRDRIWAYTIVAWEHQPWLGYGWATAFAEGSPSANIIESITGWYVPSSHNGYLSMLLQLGAVGLVVLVWFTAASLVRSFSQAVKESDPTWRWVFMVVVVFAVNNIFDTRLDSTAWLFTVAAAVWLKQAKAVEPSVPRAPMSRQQRARLARR